MKIMKKLVASLSLVAAALFTSGCETATQLGSMSQAGMTALSCDQVYAAFNAYKADKNSADAWIELFKTISPETDAKALIGDRSPEKLFNEATLYANVALSVQGCRTI